MTPTQLKQHLLRINADEDNDTEDIHRLMDEALCKTLETLGYSEGIHIFKQTHKWYS